MVRTFEYVIDSSQTVKRFLLKNGYSKRCLSFLKNHNGVILNGSHVFMTAEMKPEDVLKIVFDESEDNNMVVDTDIPLDIVYLDDDIIVVNKQAGLPVHPSYDNFTHTLANRLSFYFHSRNETYVNRCITRLDTDTSGFVLLARNPYSSALLSTMLRNKEIHKQYTALVSGNFTETCGTVNKPIYRPSLDSVKRAVATDENGHQAITDYEVVKQIPGTSLLHIDTRTGRTHQIRVHMAYIGHPLLGDRLYNPEPDTMPRQCLHVNWLSFRHPITKELMEFSSPIPEDMKMTELTD